MNFIIDEFIVIDWGFRRDDVYVWVNILGLVNVVVGLYVYLFLSLFSYCFIFFRLDEFFW